MMSSQMIKPGDILWAEVTRSKRNEDTGVKVCERNGKLWVIGINEDSLFKRWTPLEAGDQLLEINGKNVDGLALDHVNEILKEERHVKVKACRAQYGLYDSNTICTITDNSEFDD
jgi:C-terminal processing protease CtpA/Prc